MYLLTDYLVFYFCILEIVLDSRDQSVNEKKSPYCPENYVLILFEYCCGLF